MRFVGLFSSRTWGLARWAMLGALLAFVALAVVGCGAPQESAPPGVSNVAPPAPASGAPAPAAQSGPQLPPAPAPDVSSLKFSALSFAAPADQYKSRWYKRVTSETLSLKDGLHADMVGSADQSAGQYAGVKFPASAPKALRLDLTLDRPEGIKVLYVDGYASGGSAADPPVRWEWRNQNGKRMTAGRATYVLVPGKSSGYFDSVAGTDAASVQEVDVFAMVAPNASAGFTLHKVEVAR